MKQGQGQDEGRLGVREGDLIKILRKMGGEIYADDEGSYNDLITIEICDLNRRLAEGKKSRKSASKHARKVVCHKWILDSISSYKVIEMSSYVLG